MKQQKRYSEAFKLKVLEEYKAARWKNVNQMAVAYNISYATIAKWMVKYGHGHLLNRRIFVDTADEMSELAKVKAENKRLKETLKNMTVDYYIERAMVALLCEETGQKREDLKKKDGFRSYTLQK